ncbi:error-prone DNA polymerase, partial [Vibrio parahaemolyticus]|nr:error-prone DNA polymerase [Vibrio parahaemolyticus]
YHYYFLTIHDIVMFAKQQGILYQGRGSAANSVVCYCLEITAVDPRQIAVLFERFISKERKEPPDIDVDFEHERREEVIQYIYKKYGRERAALAATVISYRFKSAVREVGKALGIEETQLDFFIKNVNRRDRSQGWQAQIIELGLQPESLKGQQFIQLVNEIIGFPRHLSQHVGGFVISSGPLYELVPV